MFNPRQLRETVATIKPKNFNLSKRRELVVSGVGLVCTGLFFFSPTQDRVEANVDERGALDERIGSITAVTSYLDDTLLLIRSPDETKRIIGANFDRTTYDLPETERGIILLGRLNERFQEMQEDPLIGDALVAVEEAETKEEAVGAVVLARMDLQDEQSEARQALAKIPEYKTIETGNKGRRVVLGMGTLALTTVALLAKRLNLVGKLNVRRRSNSRWIDKEVAAFHDELERMDKEMRSIAHLDFNNEA